MPLNRVKPHVILGIVGDSAAGKTTLTGGIADILGSERVTAICTDDYHKYSRRRRAEIGITALDPRCNYVDIIEQHLRLLRQGQPILKPIYNHGTGELDAPEYVEPKEYIIVEGLLGYTTRAMRECYDVKAYLDPDPDLRIRWKIQRDTAKRGYTREQVVKQLQDRAQDSPSFIHPQRTFADIVIHFLPPEEDLEDGRSPQCPAHPAAHPAASGPHADPRVGREERHPSRARARPGRQAGRRARDCRSHRRPQRPTGRGSALGADPGSEPSARARRRLR
jgi:phosphoribulokinase